MALPRQEAATATRHHVLPKPSTRKGWRKVALGRLLASFSQVSVVFEQENPLSLDYVRLPLGRSTSLMPVHVALSTPVAAWGKKTGGHSL